MGSQVLGFCKSSEHEKNKVNQKRRKEEGEEKTILFWIPLLFLVKFQ